MSERFVDFGSVDNFIAEQENKATLQNSQRDVKLLQTFLGTRGPFLESPGNFTGPKSNIQIKI